MFVGGLCLLLKFGNNYAAMIIAFGFIVFISGVTLTLEGIFIYSPRSLTETLQTRTQHPKKNTFFGSVKFSLTLTVIKGFMN